MGLRLGYHYHTPAAAENDAIRLPGYAGLFIDSLAARCEALTCFLHSPVGAEWEQMDYPIRSANVRLVDLGPHDSVPRRTLRAFANRRLFQDAEAQVDVMLVRAATPLLPVIAGAFRKPVALLLVSDAIGGVDDLPQPGWRKALIRGWAQWNQAQQDRLTRTSLTFVNSRILYDQLRAAAPRLVETRTTTLSENDFYLRANTCQTRPYRLLYTGRLSRVKGLIEAVEAVAHLAACGYDVVLDLVGMVEKSEPILNEISQLARALGVGERIRYQGYKPAGPELLDCYRQADIYVFPSCSQGEGFPRTLWEAMASSLPVVATTVGSIPAYASEAAVLVPPKDAMALANGIESLLLDANLRGELIQKGMLLARDNTLEKRSAEMVGHIEAWLAALAKA